MILTNSRKNTNQRCLFDSGLNLSRAQRTIETEQVSDEAGNVWRRHRSSRKGFSRSVIKSRDYVKPGSPYVDAGTKIREGSLSVINGRGGNGDCLFNTRGGGISCVLVLVSCSDDDRDTSVDELKEETGINTSER